MEETKIVKEPDQLEGYIHSVSPMKTANISKKKYFNYSLQKEDDTVRGVCFSPQKYAELKTLEKTKSPVKLQNYKVSATNDIIIDQKSRLSPMDHIPFVMSDVITANDVTSISALINVMPEQIITLKAQVTHVSPVKVMITQNHGPLRKQEVLLRDPSGTIKLVLWEQYVDLLVPSQTYNLENLKVKVYNDQRYLNTPRDEEFQCNETDPFEQPLPEPQQVIDTPSITGTVVGVKDITNITACTSCGKKTTPYQSSETLGQCQGCNLIQILASCDIQWSLRLLIKASDGSKRIISVYNQQLLQLLNVLMIELELNLVSAEQLTVALLQNTTILCISYNASNNKMLDVQIA